MSGKNVFSLLSDSEPKSEKKKKAKPMFRSIRFSAFGVAQSSTCLWKLDDLYVFKLSFDIFFVVDFYQRRLTIQSVHKYFQYLTPIGEMEQT